MILNNTLYLTFFLILRLHLGNGYANTLYEQVICLPQELMTTKALSVQQNAMHTVSISPVLISPL